MIRLCFPWIKTEGILASVHLPERVIQDCQSALKLNDHLCITVQRLKTQLFLATGVMSGELFWYQKVMWTYLCLITLLAPPIPQRPQVGSRLQNSFKKKTTKKKKRGEMFSDSFIALILNVIRCSHCSNNKQRTETKVNIWWQPTDCVILLSPETEAD